VARLYLGSADTEHNSEWFATLCKSESHCGISAQASVFGLLFN